MLWKKIIEGVLWLCAWGWGRVCDSVLIVRAKVKIDTKCCIMCELF